MLYVEDDEPQPSHVKRLELLPDAQGPVSIMHAPGPLAFEGSEGTAHPLLVYTDLLHEGEPRAREGAVLFAEKYLKDDFVQ